MVRGGHRVAAPDGAAAGAPAHVGGKRDLERVVAQRNTTATTEGVRGAFSDDMVSGLARESATTVLAEEGKRYARETINGSTVEIGWRETSFEPQQGATVAYSAPVTIALRDDVTSPATRFFVDQSAVVIGRVFCEGEVAKNAELNDVADIIEHAEFGPDYKTGEGANEKPAIITFPYWENGHWMSVVMDVKNKITIFTDSSGVDATSFTDKFARGLLPTLIERFGGDRDEWLSKIAVTPAEERVSQVGDVTCAVHSILNNAVGVIRETGRASNEDFGATTLPKIKAKIAEIVGCPTEEITGDNLPEVIKSADKFFEAREADGKRSYELQAEFDQMVEARVAAAAAEAAAVAAAAAAGAEEGGVLEQVNREAIRAQVVAAGEFPAMQARINVLTAQSNDKKIELEKRIIAAHSIQRKMAEQESPAFKDLYPSVKVVEEFQSMEAGGGSRFGAIITGVIDCLNGIEANEEDSEEDKNTVKKLKEIAAITQAKNIASKSVRRWGNQKSWGCLGSGLCDIKIPDGQEEVFLHNYLFPSLEMDDATAAAVQKFEEVVRMNDNMSADRAVNDEMIMEILATMAELPVVTTYPLPQPPQQPDTLNPRACLELTGDFTFSHGSEKYDVKVIRAVEGAAASADGVAPDGKIIGFSFGTKSWGASRGERSLTGEGMVVTASNPIDAGWSNFVLGYVTQGAKKAQLAQLEKQKTTLTSLADKGEIIHHGWSNYSKKFVVLRQVNEDGTISAITGPKDGCHFSIKFGGGAEERKGAAENDIPDPCYLLLQDDGKVMYGNSRGILTPMRAEIFNTLFEKIVREASEVRKEQEDSAPQLSLRDNLNLTGNFHFENEDKHYEVKVLRDGGDVAAADGSHDSSSGKIVGFSLRSITDNWDTKWRLTADGTVDKADGNEGWAALAQFFIEERVEKTREMASEEAPGTSPGGASGAIVGSGGIGVGR